MGGRAAAEGAAPTAGRLWLAPAPASADCRRRAKASSDSPGAALALAGVHVSKRVSGRGNEGSAHEGEGEGWAQARPIYATVVAMKMYELTVTCVRLEEGGGRPRRRHRAG